MSSSRDEIDRLRAALRALAGGHWELSLATGELAWDPGPMGIPSAERTERTDPLPLFLAAIHADDRQRVADAVKAATNGQSTLRIRFRMPAADGERHAMLVAEVARDAAGRPTHLAGGLIDVSEDARREQAGRHRLVEQLRHRDQALEEFTHMVHHDLTAPLRAVTMVAEWLREELQPHLTEKSSEYLRLLHDRTQLLQALVDGALAFARACHEPSAIEPMESADALREAMEAIGASPDRVQLVGALPRVRYDRKHLVKVFGNLLDNALRHGAGKDAGDQRPVEVSAVDTPDLTTFRVTDHGVGIDARHHKRLFQLFSRGPGTRGQRPGVGLAIVRLIVTRHGGTVHVESTVGQGATFSFTIPKAGDAAT